jgi:hypothetical protein
MWSSRAVGLTNRTSAPALGLATCLAALATASPAPAQPPAPASAPASAPAPAPAHPLSPEVQQLEKAPPTTGRPIVWIGASIFSLSYIATALVATTSYLTDSADTTPHGALWIPLVGPFIVMGKSSGAGHEFLLALDGAVQITGLTLFVYGQTRPKSPRPDDTPEVTVSIAPLVARGTGGASVLAAF